MKDKMFIIGKLLAAFIFMVVLSLMGMGTGKPIMILAYAGFFIVVMFVIFQMVRRNQRHFEVVNKQNNAVSKYLGIVLTLAGIIAPALAITKVTVFDLGTIKVGFGLFSVTLAITIGLIAGMTFAVYLINKAMGDPVKRALGYLIIIVLSAVPALCVMPFDRTTTGIGSIYYLAFIVTIISWWGISLYLNKE